MKCSSLTALVVAFLIPVCADAAQAPDSGLSNGEPTPITAQVLGEVSPASEVAEPHSVNADTEAAPRWICQRSDNVCGLDNPRALSDPAKLDYDKALEAAPSMKEMKRKGIDPATPEGRVLRSKAQDELQKAADTIRQQKGHCSVWKAIRHTDGRSVTDLTDEIIAELGK